MKTLVRKWFFRTIATLIMNIVTIGFIAPFLISYSSTFLVLIGIALIILQVYIDIELAMRWFLKTKQEETK